MSALSVMRRADTAVFQFLYLLAAEAQLLSKDLMIVFAEQASLQVQRFRKKGIPEWRSRYFYLTKNTVGDSLDDTARYHVWVRHNLWYGEHGCARHVVILHLSQRVIEPSG